jgi:hypothetical protein
MITLENIEFDLSRALQIIKSDETLSKIFEKHHGANYNMMFLNIKANILNQDKINTIKMLFDEGIIPQRHLLEMYIRFKTPDAAIEDTIIIKPNSDTPKLIINPCPQKPPRRLRVKDIHETAKARGGKYTESERMLLEVSKLQNISYRLHNAGKLNTFTDEECRIVIAAIDILECKTNKIFKKW